MIGLPRSAFRKFSSVLLVAFGLALIVSVFHHHEDGQIHDTCPLCVYIAHHSDAVLQEAPPVLLSPSHLFLSLESHFPFPSTFHYPWPIRAPPA